MRSNEAASEGDATNARRHVHASDALGAQAAAARGGRRERVAYVAIFLLALVLRLVAVFQYEARHPNAGYPVIDEASYDRWARAIAAGDWIGSEVFFQEPLYPYALAVVYAVAGPERIVARVAQCFLWALAAVLVGRLARRAFSVRAGLVAGLGLALYWPGLLFPSLLLKENLFLPLFAAFALLLVAGERRRPRLAWWGIGALGALGALLRGNMLVLLPLIALWPFGRALLARGQATRVRPLAASALVLLGAACVLAPVVLRNRAVGGVFVLTTSGAGTNLYGGNNPENPYGRATEFSFVRGVPEHEAGDWRHEAERRLGRALDPAEVSDYWKSEVVRSFQADPALHLSILWRKLWLSLGGYEVPDNHLLAWDASYVPIARLPLPGFGIVGTLGLAGLVLVLLRRVAREPLSVFAPSDPRAALELALLFVLYLATIVLTVTSDRARLPLVVPLAAFAGHALVVVVRAARERRVAALATSVAVIAACALFVTSPVLPAEDRAADWDEREYNLAVQRLREPDRLDDAAAIAARLADAHPGSARVRMLLAEIATRRALAIEVGQSRKASLAARRAGLEGALASIERYCDDPRLAPRERFRARHLAAWIQVELGRWREAERRYREALDFDPESRDVLRGLARALVGASQETEEREPRARLEEALALLRDLRADPPTKDEADDLDLLLAQGEYFLGRAILDAAPRDDGDREAGRAAIRSALERLRPIAESLESTRDHGRRARVLAGWIQVELAGWKKAENHFRSALDLGPDPDAELGLALALITTAEASSSDAEKEALVREARRLLDLVAEVDPGLPAAGELRLRLENVR